MENLTIGKIPHLALFATHDISIGDEVTYDYGDKTAWWRKVNIVIIFKFSNVEFLHNSAIYLNFSVCFINANL